MVRGIVVLVALVLGLPASARAADVKVDENGLLSFTAQPGKVNNVTFAESSNGTVTIGVGVRNDDPLVPGTRCSTVAATVVCSGVSSAVIEAGDLSDRITAYDVDEDDDNAFLFGLTTIRAIISGGDGNDAIDGGGRSDSIDGGRGDDTIDGFAGDDTIRGGDGNDELKPNIGNDTLVGGDGIDTATYGLRVSPRYSLDGLANDGGTDVPVENDLIGVDVENVEAAAASTQTVTITGDGRANRLTVQTGRGNITGGDGADILEGASQDDTINSRDGAPDVVICNGGSDTVLADTLDTVSPSCENVQVQATPGGAFDDRAPTLQWAAPAGASLSANTATTLSVSAADDRGVAKVQFFDDDRLVCEVTAAPYNCAYQPRGGDVGRNTLIAVATDGAGQTASAVRVVEVRRFSPKDVSLSLRPSRDRRSPYSFRLTGKVSRPDAVSPSQGCGGSMSIVAKRGRKTISTHRVSVSTRTCEFRSTFTWRKRPTSRVRFQAKFGGNTTLATASSKTRTARLG